MDDSATTAAAVAKPRPPGCGFFAFLKDGVLVVTRNRRLFLQLAALHASRVLVAATMGLEANVNGDGVVEFDRVAELLADSWWLLAAGAAARLANEALGLAIQAATTCAAVVSCSAASTEGGPGRTTLTLGSLLGKEAMRRNLRGAMATAVFGNVAWWAALGARKLVVLTALGATTDFFPGPIPSVLVSLLMFTTMPLLIAYGVRCKVAIIVSVAEPMSGGGAVRRARRLTRGCKKVARATMYTLLSSELLPAAVWKMHAAGMARVPRSIPAVSFTLDAVVASLLLGGIKVLRMATLITYYFHCRRTQDDDKAGHTE